MLLLHSNSQYIKQTNINSCNWIAETKCYPDNTNQAAYFNHYKNNLNGLHICNILKVLKNKKESKILSLYTLVIPVNVPLLCGNTDKTLAKTFQLGFNISLCLDSSFIHDSRI